MRFSSKLFGLGVVITGLAASSGIAMASATDVYIAQSAAGANNGSSCANARAYSFFNSGANWGSGTTQIGPGTTVHLCGTFTAAAGASGYLVFQGNGTSGNPVTLLFESGAALTAPYWGGNGAIYASGASYITIDGGSNGTIRATANGTALTYQKEGGAGMRFDGCSNCEVKNLTIANMYVHTTNLSDTNGDIYALQWIDGSNVSMHDNTIHDGGWCAYYAFTGSGRSNVSIHDNTIYNCNGSIVVGSGNTGASVSGVSIYGNTLHDSVNWDDSADSNHHDGVHLWAVHSGSSWSNVQIYNNYFYGDWGIHTTGQIFIEANGGGTGTGSNAIYNNLMTASNAAAHALTNGNISLQANGWYVVNNTFVNDSNGGTGGGAIQADSGTGATVMNNILMASSTAINFPSGTSITSGDYNDYYNIGTSIPFIYAGRSYSDFPTFRSGSSLDAHSLTSNPNLDSTGKPQASSPVIGAGTNLSALCPLFTGLCADMAGTPRPATGAWAMGAYSAGQAQTLIPPTLSVLAVQ